MNLESQKKKKFSFGCKSINALFKRCRPLNIFSIKFHKIIIINKLMFQLLYY